VTYSWNVEAVVAHPAGRLENDVVGLFESRGRGGEASLIRRAVDSCAQLCSIYTEIGLKVALTVVSVL